VDKDLHRISPSSLLFNPAAAGHHVQPVVTERWFLSRQKFSQAGDKTAFAISKYEM